MMENAFRETRLLEEASGDEDRQQVLARLYSGHRPRLRSMVQVRLDPRLQARLDPSDVLQDIYVEATRRLDEYVRSPTLPLFLGTACATCADSADSNDDGTVDLSDGIFTLSCLLLGEACPPLPHEVCGSDPTEDKLDCDAFAACEL